MARAIIIGVLSDNPLVRRDIKLFAERFGLGLDICVAWQDWGKVNASLREDVCCWLVDTDQESEDDFGAMSYLQECDSAVIFGLEPLHQEEPKRERQLAGLLQKLMYEIDQKIAPEYEDDFEPEVWVLAASMGGPPAVKEFIDSLPENFPVIFLYAQHLDDQGSKALVDVIGRNAKLPVRPFSEVTVLKPGIVYTVPTHTMVDFTPNLAFELKHPWSGYYSPSIDELLTNAHRCFGRRLNVIYFSGMGGDGAEKAARMHEEGSQVWAQSPNSSISSAMPESVIRLGICKNIASPKDLALLLRARMQRKRTVSIR